MIDTSSVKLTLAFTDPDLADQQREQQIEELQAGIADFATVKTVGRMTGSAVPVGSRAFASFLTGLLMAEVNPENIKKLFGFLSDRFGNQPLEINLEKADGSKLSLKANSREELEFLFKQAQEFIKG
ncbi:hypothetical protein [Calothrix sp. PCC 6303]|uniref:hypothetical protein n=1 Tax=Calothrix sp. PCC 6303 TaxID=1170562 RepID=UPI0002A00513|nr:hypothetical protein [Calothrix sp. PCC 6303]AFZ02992.1 hypothetical protein Cal6303_4076 [Calothrix sp. PCC 6303]